VLGPGFLDYFIHGGPIAVLGAADAMVLQYLMDVSMNSAEEEVVDALINAEKDSKLLKKMAERHMDLLDRIADARQRQLEAAETASSRVHDLGGTFDDEDDFYDEGFDYDPYDDFD